MGFVTRMAYVKYNTECKLVPKKAWIRIWGKLLFIFWPPPKERLFYVDKSSIDGDTVSLFISSTVGGGQDIFLVDNHTTTHPFFGHWFVANSCKIFSFKVDWIMFRIRMNYPITSRQTHKMRTFIRNYFDWHLSLPWKLIFPRVSSVFNIIFIISIIFRPDWGCQ